MILKSIRWRIQAWHGLILVVVLGGFGFAAYHAARDNQARRVDEELTQRIGAALRPGPPEGAPDQPSRLLPRRGRPGEWRDNSPLLRSRIREALDQSGAFLETNSYYYVLWNDSGLVEAASLNAPADVPRPDVPLVRPRPDEFEFQRGGRGGRGGPPPMFRDSPPDFRSRADVREVFRPLPSGDVLLIGRPMTRERASMRRFALWLAAAGSGILALGLAGGWLMSGRALRPVEEIGSTAAKISAGDLSQRISLADTESELGRLAGVLNATFARLEAAFANQARFTSDASHELRTPVSVILTQTQTALTRERDPEEYRETLTACQRAAQRMRRLTDSLLELAKFDAGQNPLSRERLDLGNVAREAVDLVRPLAEERGIQLDCEIGRVECLGDPGRIGQVAANFLTNAIRFNREHGLVRIRVAAHNGTALLAVSDTGPGIPEQHVPHVFERFYVVDESRSRRDGSTGLGLAICKAIADAHNGNIRVESRVGEGTTFTLELPCA